MSSSRSSPPSAIPLTGADCFLRAFDAEIRRFHGASHLSQLVLRLGPGLDVDALERCLRAVADANPILRAPIARRWGVGAPAYLTGRARRRETPFVRVHAGGPAPAPAIPPLFFARMNERLDPRGGHLLHFDAVLRDGGRDGADLAMTWLHMLFDGSGSEGFLRWLEACHRGESRPDEPPDAAAPAPEPPAPLGERGDRARRWQQRMRDFGRTPPRSPAGPLARVRQRLRYRVLTLDPEETAVAVERAKRRAGFLTPMLFYLAAAVRAHHAVFQARGVDPGCYLVPLPVNVRPKGAEAAVFRTHVSLLWFCIPPALADDFDALLAELKEQRLASIREGLVEAGLDAMDFARFAPRRLYARMARDGLGGELCSFFFAWTGEFLAGVDEFFGAPIRNGFHAAPVPPSPGSCLATSVRGGRLNATHVHQEGVFADDELALFDARLRADLCGGRRGSQRGTAAQ
jgi:hypothetical protein